MSNFVASPDLIEMFDNSNSNNSKYSLPVAPTGEVVPWPEAPTGVIMQKAPQHNIAVSAVRNSKFNKYVAELLATVQYCHKYCKKSQTMTNHMYTINKLSGEIVALDNGILMSQKGGRRTRNKRRRNTNRK